MVCQLEPAFKLASNKQFVYHLINKLKVGPGSGCFLDVSRKHFIYNHKPYTLYVLSSPRPPQDFSEWAQCAVLELVSHYRPSGESEVRGTGPVNKGLASCSVQVVCAHGATRVCARVTCACEREMAVSDLHRGLGTRAACM